MFVTPPKFPTETTTSTSPRPRSSSITTTTTTIGTTTEGVCREELTSPEGTLSSPGYPDSAYPLSADCGYHIAAEEGAEIQLTFTHMDVR